MENKPNPPITLCRGWWGDWDDASRNDGIRKEWEIFFCEFNFITPIPNSFHHFWWEKMRKKRILPTRDQKIVTLDWMNPILNDGKAEGREFFSNKGEPLRFFFFLIPRSFQRNLVIPNSFSDLNEKTNFCFKKMNIISFRMTGNESGMISLVILNGK